MKKKLILISIIVFCMFCISLDVFGYHATGHENISKVEFDGDGHLLVDITNEELEMIISNLDKKFFGWETAYFNYNRKVKYEGDIIFSKVNRSSAPIVFEYEMNDEEVTTTSISASGSISTKITGTIEKIKTQIALAISGSIEYKGKEEVTTTKTTKIDISIMPGRKLTLVTKGDAYITSGYSKYYFFGIALRKGTWERIEIDTIYYELIEEEVE